MRFARALLMAVMPLSLSIAGIITFVCAGSAQAQDAAMKSVVSEFYQLLARGRSAQLERLMSKDLLDMIQGLGANKQGAFKTLQEQAPPNVQVTSEVETSESEACLHVMGTWTEPFPAVSYGTVYLKNELGGGWKIDRHEWEPRKRTTPQIPSASVRQSSTAAMAPTRLQVEDATRMRFPSQPAQGKLKGETFMVENASFSGETLAFEQGKDNKLELVLPHGSLVPGRSVAVTAQQSDARHKVVIYKNGERTSSLKEAGSSLRLQFGELKNNRISGYIIVKYPEQNTEIAGYFYANKK